MLDVKGQIALVTGATGGIGGAIVRMFIQCGATVFATGTNESKLQTLSNELGDNFKYIVCDLSCRDSVYNLITQVTDQTGGKLDILVCNAGITRDNLFVRMTDAQFDEVININLSSSFILNREAGKIMMRQRYGRIINVSSISGIIGNPGQANYSASKAGLIGMTKSIAKELASRNVTVNCIAPGFVETPMTDKLTEKQKEAIMNMVPIRRYGTPEDIAYSTLFLASKQASYITGHVLNVNGGMI